MSVEKISDVEFGEELPTFTPDTSLETGSRFAEIAWGMRAARFSSHEKAKEEGLPAAMIPGILNQGYLVAMIHHWAPAAEVISVDTVFRAPVTADEAHSINGVVTDIDEENNKVEIDLTVANGQGETRVFGTAVIKLPG
jgi:hypothetical protein